LAIIFEHRPNETSIDVPEIDLNYGVGDHIQLTLQNAPILLKRSGHGLIGGSGGTEVALKWRFLDEATSGLDMSMFPSVIFNIVQSSVRPVSLKMAHAFKFHFRWRRPSAAGMRTSTSVRERRLLVEANGYMDSSAGSILPNQ
jgi:hypothetical protein